MYTPELNYFEGIAVKTFDAVYKRFWRVVAKTDMGAVSLSNIFIGEAFSAPTEMRSPNYGWSFEEIDNSRVQIGFYGQPFIDPRNEQKVIKISVNNLKRDIFENYNRMISHLGITKPLIFVADEAGSIIEDPMRFASYGLIAKSPEITNDFYQTYSSNFELREII